jgi:hypothetical protein
VLWTDTFTSKSEGGGGWVGWVNYNNYAENVNHEHNDIWSSGFCARLIVQMLARSPASQGLLKRHTAVEAKELCCESADTVLELILRIASHTSPEYVHEQSQIANEFGHRVIGLHR